MEGKLISGKFDIQRASESRRKREIPVPWKPLQIRNDSHRFSLQFSFPQAFGSASLRFSHSIDGGIKHTYKKGSSWDLKGDNLTRVRKNRGFFSFISYSYKSQICHQKLLPLINFNNIIITRLYLILLWKISFSFGWKSLKVRAIKMLHGGLLKLWGV